MRQVVYFIFCLLLMSVPASYEGNIGARDFAPVLMGVAGFQSVFFSVICCLLAKYLGKTVKYGMAFILLLLFIVETYTYIQFGSRLNSMIISLLLQTNIQEIKEFFSLYIFSPFTLLFIILVIAGCWLFYKLDLYCEERYSFRTGKIIDTIILIISICGAYGSIQMVEEGMVPPGKNTIYKLADSWIFYDEKRYDIAEIERQIDLIKAEKVDSKAPIIVLVIGESFNKYHSSLYGYDLKTNPLLEKRLENKELAVFKDVVSPSNGTNYMMEYVFSLKSCDRQDDAKRNILFPAVFRKAGYRVGYFDNQYTQTSGGNYDFTCCYFLNTHKISNACFDYRNDTLMNYDGPFIDYYKSKFYRQSRSMNIIHLYGQHLDPRFRFPEDFASFSAKDIKRNDLDEGKRQQVADYDNAVLYNDKVMDDIIRCFEQQDAVLIYFSDHGEQIYDDQRLMYGRKFGVEEPIEAIKCEYEIPFMIWCSKAFQEQHTAFYKRIMASVDKPFCSDDIPYLLFDLGGIRSVLADSTRSVIHPAFYPRQRKVMDNKVYDKQKADAVKLLIE